MTNTEYTVFVDAALNASEERELWSQFLDVDLCDIEEIYKAAHRTIKEIAAAAGMSLRQLGLHFAIPRRTIGDWSTGKRTPPPYVLLLMQEALGLLDVRRK
jgi:DNA-binding transcriptional regulator YiaG